MKRQYKITLIIALILIVFVGGYFLLRSFLSGDSPQPNGTSTSTEQGDFPDVGDIDEQDNETSTSTEEITEEESENNIPRLISDEGNDVFDSWIDEGTGEAMYITTEGRIYNAKIGQDIEISNQPINALNWVEISPSKEYLLAAFGDPKNPDWGIFDTEDSVWRPLPSSIDNATWAVNDSLLIINETNQTRTLEQVNTNDGSVTDFDLGSDIILSDFGMRDIEMEAVSEQRLIVYEKPSVNYLSRVWEVNLETGSIENIIQGERGLLFNWSGSHIFKFSSEEEFFILDYNLQNSVPVFFDTLPSKCGELDSVIYCGVPEESFFSNTMLPDSYLMRSVFSVDDLYKIDLNSLTPEIVFESGDGDVPFLDIKNPRISNGDLYFINRYNEGLYQLSI